MKDLRGRRWVVTDTLEEIVLINSVGVIVGLGFSWTFTFGRLHNQARFRMRLKLRGFFLVERLVMRTHSFGDPLYHNLGLGRHQCLADFPANSHVEATMGQ